MEQSFFDASTLTPIFDRCDHFGCRGHGVVCLTWDERGYAACAAHAVLVRRLLSGVATLPPFRLDAGSGYGCGYCGSASAYAVEFHNFNALLCADHARAVLDGTLRVDVIDQLPPPLRGVA